MTAAAGFYVLAAVAVVSALGVILARNVVHAVLFMVAHFLNTAALYVMLHAPFVAMVQVVVYAGAIMVLFLFVVMLIGRHDVSWRKPTSALRILGALLVGALCAVLVFTVLEGVPAAPPSGDLIPPSALAADFGSPAAIGDLLFRAHVLAFEIISMLLLVAIIGAVVIARAHGGPQAVGVPDAMPDSMAGAPVDPTADAPVDPMAEGRC